MLEELCSLKLDFYFFLGRHLHLFMQECSAQGDRWILDVRCTHGNKHGQSLTAVPIKKDVQLPFKRTQREATVRSRGQDNRCSSQWHAIPLIGLIYTVFPSIGPFWRRSATIGLLDPRSHGVLTAFDGCPFNLSLPGEHTRSEATVRPGVYQTGVPP